MEGSRVLVLGGTGPAGICLLRELVYRGHSTVVYARQPSKIPDDVKSNHLLEIIEGEISDKGKLGIAMAKSSTVISLLGPDIKNPRIDPALYPTLYSEYILPSMREHGTKRIFLMGTLSIKQPDDSWTAFQTMVITFMRLFANQIYLNMVGLADLFQSRANDLDWTMFRIAQIIGESDEASWRTDREKNELFTGNIGQRGWTSSIRRASLALWLVNALENKSLEWVRKMPAVSQRG